MELDYDCPEVFPVRFLRTKKRQGKFFLDVKIF